MEFVLKMTNPAVKVEYCLSEKPVHCQNQVLTTQWCCDIWYQATEQRYRDELRVFQLMGVFDICAIFFSMCTCCIVCNFGLNQIIIIDIFPSQDSTLKVVKKGKQKKQNSCEE